MSSRRPLRDNYPTRGRAEFIVGTAHLSVRDLYLEVLVTAAVSPTTMEALNFFLVGSPHHDQFKWLRRTISSLLDDTASARYDLDKSAAPTRSVKSDLGGHSVNPLRGAHLRRTLHTLEPLRWVSLLPTLPGTRTSGRLTSTKAFANAFPDSMLTSVSTRMNVLGPELCAASMCAWEHLTLRDCAWEITDLAMYSRGDTSAGSQGVPLGASGCFADSHRSRRGSLDVAFS